MRPCLSGVNGVNQIMLRKTVLKLLTVLLGAMEMIAVQEMQGRLTEE